MGTPTRFYSNNAIPGAIGNPGGLGVADTSLYLTATPQGYPQQFPFSLRLSPGTANEEVASVTAGAGTAGSPWTIQRGFDGTLAVVHPPGVPGSVAHGLIALDGTASRAHEASDSDSSPLPHGLPLSAWQTSSFAVINETLLPTSTTTVVTFGSIPQTFTHLLIIAQGRLTSTSAQLGEMACTLNGDTAAVYSKCALKLGTTTGSLSGPTATSSGANTSWSEFIQLAASQAGSAANAGGGWALLPNYAGTTFNKSFLGASGFGNGTDTAVNAVMRWGWYNPSVQAGITSLSLSASIGAFRAGTLIGLYGLA